MHMYFFTVAEFDDEDNHVLHILIGAGFTGLILFYAFSDGVRFLRSNFDKILYLISCLLQKPLLLPILMPNRFRSRIAVKHISNYTVNIEQQIEVDGKMINNTKRIQPTNFLLAVQETNFLYSFTLSGFVAMSTACTMLIQKNFNDEKYGNLAIQMLVVSVVYCVYGVWISIFLYGRKIDHLK